MSLLSSLLELPPQPELVRHSYRRELVTEATLPIAFAVMEGGFVGVIADKIFNVSPIVLAVITAAPMFSNLSSFIWARLVHGRPKVRFVVMIQYLILLFTGVIAFVPEGESGAFVLVGAIIIVRLLMVGLVTARSLVWSLNYSRNVRARITGRLTIVNSLIMVLVAAGGGLLLDASPDSFRWTFAAAAILGLFGVNAFSKILVLNEDEHLAMERDKENLNKISMLQVLRTDKKFAEYQVYQFLAGTSNMMLEAPVIYLVSNQLGASYTVSIGITVIVPFIISMLTLPVWANYLDQNHVTLFRARQSALWVVSQLTMFVGALLSSLLTLALGRLVLGIARGGGSLAWNLGHNDFANQQQLAAYMGAHVTLTGIRGAFAPFMGILLYTGWEASAMLPGFEGIGAGVFLIAAGLSGISWFGYQRLKKLLQAEMSLAPVVADKNQTPVSKED